MTNFAGMLCYVLARQCRQHGSGHVFRSAVWTITSGILFGIATMLRSNGLFSGLILAWDVLLLLPRLPGILEHRSWGALIHLTGIVLGGLAIAIGYGLPQVVAYFQYCTAENARPWCSKALPSIYTFVQSHYWNVGLFRYWTASNLPLFALAGPMLLVLVGTGYAVLDSAQLSQVVGAVGTTSSKDHISVDESSSQNEKLFVHTISRLALPQVALAFVALFGFHVQIVNRISSGYPVWYIMLAIAIDPSRPKARPKASSIIDILRNNAQFLVRASMVYAIVQGGLYASFMPPA